MQSYDAVLQAFQTQMEDLHGPAPAKRQRMQRGAEVARHELDALNNRYRALVATVTEKVDNISAVGKEENVSTVWLVIIC